ncbi:hypothetical protein FOA52_010722 [Chlamydomonas sp. UWO 241]|nr:hypothetical protein FOA52_010722 [Chlamydomonas sp. UWO 241]
MLTRGLLDPVVSRLGDFELGCLREALGELDGGAVVKLEEASRHSTLQHKFGSDAFAAGHPLPRACSWGADVPGGRGMLQRSLISLHSLAIAMPVLGWQHTYYTGVKVVREASSPFQRVLQVEDVFVPRLGASFSGVSPGRYALRCRMALSEMQPGIVGMATTVEISASAPGGSRGDGSSSSSSRTVWTPHAWATLERSHGSGTWFVVDLACCDVGAVCGDGGSSGAPTTSGVVAQADAASCGRVGAAARAAAAPGAEGAAAAVGQHGPLHDVDVAIRNLDLPPHSLMSLDCLCLVRMQHPDAVPAAE